MDLPPAGHDPVLLDETLSYLAPLPGQAVVDCTLGRAGHALALAQSLGGGGLLIGLDADPRNLEFAQQRLDQAQCKVRLFHANFAELGDVLSQIHIKRVDRIFADLGLSTNQLFDERYGLSFAQDMALDMRIDPRITRSAADLVNTLREDELADIFFHLAQERFSRRIARNIAQARRQAPINSTERLADLVRQAVPSRGREKIDPATRTFMALRMAVNSEVENLQSLLDEAPKYLNPRGRIGVISFHSTEDRMVKQAFRSAEQTGLLRILTNKPISPTDAELARNPRSRSAKLRVAEHL